ncbi:FkbM family methyltransferase [Paraburkholderia nemoris]|uniref:FkbM family methyltransferase n=1 Tax=Paraburkholderia nemoris TaxID=2793076 RepID=UPI0038BD34FD
MKLIFHIGTEKTGSSSLQLTLSSQRATLAAQGIWYPSILGEHAHRKLSLYGREYQAASSDHRLATYDVYSEQEFNLFQQQIESDLRTELELARKHECTYFVISCEYLSSLYRKESETKALSGLMTKFFSDITILCFIRPQIDVLISRVSTLACDGIEMTEEAILGLADELAYFDFNAMLDRWEVAFGREAMHPVSYLENRDTLSYLSKIIGISIPKNGLESINQSVDVESISILNATKLSGKTLTSVATYLKELRPTNRLSLPAGITEKIQLLFQESNDALAAKWPHLQLNNLPERYRENSAQSNTHLLQLALPMARQLRHVFERFQENIQTKETYFKYFQQGDLKFVFPNGHYAEKYIENGGLIRPSIVPLIKNKLQTGQTFVDIGSNIGYFSLVASKIVGDTGEVISCDPSSRALNALLHAIELNHINNITVFNSAAHKEFSTMEITHNLESTNCVVEILDQEKYGDNSSVTRNLISAVRLDQILVNLKRCDLIKIAVGGNEYPALLGAKDILTRFKPSVISEYSPDYQSDLAGNTPYEFADLFFKLGYRCFLIENDSTLSPVDDTNHLISSYDAHKKSVGEVSHLNLYFEHPAVISSENR